MAVRIAHRTSHRLIDTLSLHDALPIYEEPAHAGGQLRDPGSLLLLRSARARGHLHGDRKSTRLNSSHLVISYADFCLKKKNNIAVRNYMATMRIIVSEPANEAAAVTHQ